MYMYICRTNVDPISILGYVDHAFFPFSFHSLTLLLQLELRGIGMRDDCRTEQYDASKFSFRRPVIFFSFHNKTKPTEAEPRLVREAKSEIRAVKKSGASAARFCRTS
jgi:hypothetical protein